MGIKIVLLLLAYLGSLACLQVVEVGYNEDCDGGVGSNLICNVAMFLKCSNDTGPGKCVCDNAHWDPVKTKCITKAEGTCSSNLQCTADSLCHLKNETDPTGEKVCTCNQDFIPTPVGQCKMSHGSYGCNVPTDCDYFYAFLTCSSRGECGCIEPEHQHWEPTKNKGMCVSLVGGSCKHPTWDLKLDRCTPNADCENDLCTCSTNYKVTSEGFCLLDFDKPCTNDSAIDSTCHPNYLCLPDGSTPPVEKCQCIPEVEIYSEETGICIPKAGVSCLRQQVCLPHASCQTLTKLCKCDTGYHQTQNMTCLADFGISCNDTVEDDKCNPEKSLMCENDYCQCKGGYEYFTKYQTCLGNLGSVCTVDRDCMETARCGDTKVCECERGYTVMADGKCGRNYGWSCDDSVRICNPEKFLRCPDGTDSRICSCENPTDRRYDVQRQECVAKAGQGCMLQAIESRQLKCVPNATCLSQGEGSDLALCQCDSGFVVDANGECEIGQGGNNGAASNFGGFGALIASMMALYVWN